MTPTRFKLAVVAAARGLLLESRAGFRRRDVAKAIGEDSTRLARALKALRSVGVLASGGRGVFVAGTGLDDAALIGPGIETAHRVAAFVDDNGGMATVAELRHALQVDDDASRKALARALRAGGYRRFGGGWWLAPNLGWRDCVLPGWRIGQAVRMRLGRYGLVADNAMRTAISRGVREARDAAGLDVEDIVEGEVGALMALDLARSEAVVVTESTSTLATWWQARVDRLGEGDALVLTWCEFEEGRRLGEPWAGAALSVPTWRAFARAVAGDPVTLSRGLQTSTH